VTKNKINHTTISFFCCSDSLSLILSLSLSLPSIFSPMGVGGDDLWNPKLVSFLSRQENLLMQISSSIRRPPGNS